MAMDVRENMSDTPIQIEVVGSLVACGEGMQDTWREMTHWLADRMRVRYGTAVTTTYHDLFDPDCPPLPAEAQLPAVFINGALFSSGGKLNLPAINRRLRGLGVG